MPRNLVICFDGTSNEFGPVPTNVVRLVKTLESNSATQLVHYAPGVGTLPEPGFASRLGQQFSLLTGLAFGAGLENIASEAYSFLMDNWEPGDRVFLFGFSRGAYTARVLAGWLHALGLLPRGNQNLIPYAFRLLSSIRGLRPSEPQDRTVWATCDDFRETFARPVSLDSPTGDRRFPIHFVGVWDTVSSVGWVWDPKSYPYTASNPGIHTLRHAVALDERRCFFRQNLCYAVSGQDLQQRWFAGSHGDVGGGYPEKDSQNWRNSFEWMLRAALDANLHVSDSELAKLNVGATRTPWREKIHDSLIAKWWPAEFIPRLRWREATQSRYLKMGLGRPRQILRTPDQAVRHPETVELHHSTLRRIQTMSDYRPRNLTAAQINAIRSLDPLPEFWRVTQ